ncbi:hypothetical protein MC7420_4025 [Coleofasciculus chthonoplastes PCC 7420]|uniref:Uncharacterized protein n=2 Tax=Coleofasciculus chthonoplastes TaxID=64178 RepID=B4VUK4_9CYAN|nr:hypothetical protein MC7420_4025 [Coleofasciculus chthonoplastes PCC 7420]
MRCKPTNLTIFDEESEELRVSAKIPVFSGNLS